MKPSADPCCHPPLAEDALRLLAPPVRQWFQHRYGSPTPAQCRAWPQLLAGRSLLLSAPTGSGKTLAAIVPLISGSLPPGGGGLGWGGEVAADPYPPPHPSPSGREGAGVRCLYLAPLRALCNDLYYRLTDTFAELNELLGLNLRVGLQTGDTPQSWRQRLWKKPPDVVITTPESLALLLSRPDAASRLGNVKTVIVDEVHALAGLKRGADLAVSLERLQELTLRPVQRIGLSATAAPLRELAAWLRGSGAEVALAAVPDSRPWQLRIEHLGDDLEENGFVATVLDHVEREVERHRTTLLFTNARSITERLTWSLRRRRPDWHEQIAIHHGSLSADQLAQVEGRMQAGELKLVICSTSLELGVDLGFVDQVLMVHPPGGAARLLQRLGRAGHRPGGIRQGVLYTTSQEELWEAVVTRDAGSLAHLEPVRLPSRPLDVLCQQLIGLVLERPRTVADCWQVVRRAHPFRDLSLADFALCLEYLLGGTQRFPVAARLRLEDGLLTVVNRRTGRLFRQNTGTITTENQADIRLASGQFIGSLNSHFADRLEEGDRFLLGGQTLEVRRKNSSEIEVEPRGGVPAFSRWMGGVSYLSPLVAERMWRLRVRVREALLEAPTAARHLLRDEYRLEPGLAGRLIAQLEAQEAVSEVPCEGLLIESWASQDAETVFHACHLPTSPAMGELLARILAMRLGLGANPAIVTGRLGFLLAAPANVEVNPQTLRPLLGQADFPRDLQRVLGGSKALQIRFSEVVQTGLMLLRQPIGRRHRVGGVNWASDRLLHWLRFVEPEFPLLLQAQREIATEIYHLDRLQALLARLKDEPIRQRWLAEASPLASGWFFNPFQPPLMLTEPNLSSALLRIHAERQVAHAAT